MSSKTETETRTETQTAIDAGIQLAEARAARIIEHGGIPMAIVPQGMGVHILDKLQELQDRRADAPRRLKGTAQHKELASFIEHVNRQKDTSSVIWADPEKCTLTAVLNYNTPASTTTVAPGSPRWGDHRAVYACPLSEPWQIWMGLNEKWMGQEAFGNFIEDRLDDLANPDPENDKDMPPPAKVLEVARNLVVYSKCDFQRTINPSDGTGTFVFKKDNEVQGSTRVPREFLLGIPVFEAGDTYRVRVRLRYNVDGGVAKFQFSLYQPQVIVRDAFSGVRTKATEGTALPLFVGSPE
jgi:uncharacterized protein YfdQ (DUF2303 family)